MARTLAVSCPRCKTSYEVNHPTRPDPDGAGMKADHLTADCPDCGQGFRVKAPSGHRLLDPEQIAEEAMLTRAAEAIVTRGFRRALRERRARQRPAKPDADDAIRRFFEAWDRESR